MKEQIYTIPINEAYETDCECPFCLLEKKCEEEAVEYALGAAMMEPDYRMESNEKGYCRRHYEMMFAKPNKLSLALVMETHLAESRKEIAEFEKKVSALKNAKAGLFKKSDAGAVAAELADMLKKRGDSCIICDKINHTMDRYIDVFLDMWATEPETRAKFTKSKGLCLPHMRMLFERAAVKMPDKARVEFVPALFEKQTAELARMQEDIHRFTLKFDYRNANMEWGTAKDAPLRTIEKCTGSIRAEEN